MTDVTIALCSPLSWLAIIAKKKNFFKRSDLNADFRTFQTGRKAKDALQKGWVDLAHLIDANVAEAALDKNPRIKLLGCPQIRNDGLIVARKDAGIASPKDIEGKTLGYVHRTSSHMFILHWAKHHNIDLQTVTLKNMMVDQMERALLAGEIDACSLWQPFSIYLRLAAAKENIPLSLLENDCGYSFHVALAVHEKFLKKHKPRIDMVLNTLKQAESFAQENPTEAVQIVANSMGLDVKIFRQFQDKIELKYKDLDNNFFEQVIVQMGITDPNKTNNYENIIDKVLLTH